MIDEAKQRNILQDTIDRLKKIDEAADEAIQEREQRIRDLRIQVDAVRKSIDEKEENDMDDNKDGKIQRTLKMFREICKEKNKPEMPCAGCPLWNVCGTLPGSIDDITIDETAAAVADYLLEKEAGDAENAIPVQSGTE